MKNEDKKKKLDDYKLFLEELKKLKQDNENNKVLTKDNKTKKLVKQPNGFTNVIVPIVITVFIIGFAIGLAFAIYKF